VTSAHWRAYLLAVITFLVGGSNQLFGTHFQPDTVYTTLVLCVSLIAAEFHFIRTKEWNNAENQFLRILPHLKSLFDQLVKEYGKGFGSTVTTGAASTIKTAFTPTTPTSDNQTTADIANSLFRDNQKSQDNQENQPKS